MLKNVIKAVLIFLMLGILFRINRIEAPIIFTNIDVTNNRIAVINSHQSNVKNLRALRKIFKYAQNYASENRPIQIQFPTGKFDIGKKGKYEPIFLPSNTTLKFDQKSTLLIHGTLSFLGAPMKDQEKFSGFTWKGGSLVGNGKGNRGRFVFVQSENVKFLNTSMQQVSGFNDHVFDLNDVHEMLFNNIRIVGYGTRTLPLVKQSNQLHQYQAEAIQLDDNSVHSLTHNDRKALQSELPSFEKNRHIEGDSDITIQHSAFLPVFREGKLVLNAQNPIGQHTINDSQQTYSQNIKFIDNMVSYPVGGPLRQNDKKQNNYSGSMHFNAVRQLLIEGNTFHLGDANYAISFYTNNKLISSDVNITNNRIMTTNYSPILLRTSTNIANNGHLLISLKNNLWQLQGKTTPITAQNVQKEEFRNKVIELSP